MRIAFGGALLVSLILMACAPAQVGVGTEKQQSQSSSQSTSSSVTSLSVINDTSRNQAVLVTESGQKVDVVGVDSASGSSVACASMTGYTVIQQSDDPEALPVKALIVGQRKDGTPGVWEVHADNSIELSDADQGISNGLLTVGAGQYPDGMRTWFGWVYHTTAVSENGKIVVGYAVNLKGFKFGKLSIPARTTVGVYWNVYRVGKRNHLAYSVPLVIGSWDYPKPPQRYHAHRIFPFPTFLSLLKLFFLDQLHSYLIMATAVHYNSSDGSYAVTGTDQDGQDAVATISKNGSIDITPVQSNPTSYSEVVIDTFTPTGTGNGVGVAVIDLFSASGVSSSQDPWTSSGTGALAVDGQTGNGNNPSPDQPGWAWIDYKPAQPLSSGDVLYVRIRGYSKTTASGPYGIRILTSPSTSYTYFGSANNTDTPYEPDDNPTFGGVPTNPAQITLGTALSRCIQAAGDVDWVKITLP